jgi:hypothetical protein
MPRLGPPQVCIVGRQTPKIKRLRARIGRKKQSSGLVWRDVGGTLSGLPAGEANPSAFPSFTSNRHRKPWATLKPRKRGSCRGARRSIAQVRNATPGAFYPAGELRRPPAGSPCNRGSGHSARRRSSLLDRSSSNPAIGRTFRRDAEVTPSPHGPARERGGDR